MKSKASRSDLKTLTLTLAMPNDDDDDEDFQNPSQVIAITQNRIFSSLQNPNGAPPPRKKQKPSVSMGRRIEEHRFIYTSDLKKEEEKDQIRRKIRSHAQVSWAAILFKKAGERQVPGTRGLPVLPSGGYGIGIEQLTANDQRSRFFCPTRIQRGEMHSGLIHILKRRKKLLGFPMGSLARSNSHHTYDSSCYIFSIGHKD